MNIVYKVSCIAAPGQTTLAQNGVELDAILKKLHDDFFSPGGPVSLASVPFSQLVKVDVAVLT
jgi:hypothetical protein